MDAVLTSPDAFPGRFVRTNPSIPIRWNHSLATVTPREPPPCGRRSPDLRSCNRSPVGTPILRTVLLILAAVASLRIARSARFQPRALRKPGGFACVRFRSCGPFGSARVQVPFRSADRPRKASRTPPPSCNRCGRKTFPISARTSKSVAVQHGIFLLRELWETLCATG